VLKILSGAWMLWIKLTLLIIFCYPPSLFAQTLPQMRTQVQQLIQQARYPEAADLLEKILLTENPPRQKTIQTYRKLLKIIEQHYDRYRYLNKSTNDWQFNGLFALNTGGGTNLNRAPNRQNIQFSNGQQAQLSSEQQPQAGYGFQATAAIQANKQIQPNQQLDLALQVQHRYTNRQNFTDYLRINSRLGIRYQRDNSDEIGIALLSDTLQYDNEARFYALNLLTRYRWHHQSDCQASAGIDLQWQHQKNKALFDALYTGLSAQRQCLGLGGKYSLTLTAGNQWAINPQRPGGHQWLFRLMLNHTWLTHWLYPNSQFKSYLNASYLRDWQGYSPLLDHNRKRRIQRLTIGGQYRWRISNIPPRLWATLRLQWQRQNSHLKLFQYQSLEVWTGIEVSW